MSFTLTALTITVVVSLGLVVGFVSGLLGIGGGVLLVPVLIKLFDLDPHKAIGISLAVIVPTAMAGAFRHGLTGDINLRFAIILSIGGIIGALLGSTMGAYLSAASLKKLFGVLMVFAGMNMLFDFTERIAGKSEAVAEETVKAQATPTHPQVDLNTPVHKPG
jgi:hypothetical protein